jgi:UDP-N-acetylmuramyl pentapeptide phosphotransferase/UDP-N-acetylglucosamine-1-phosphate transferase
VSSYSLFSLGACLVVVGVITAVCAVNGFDGFLVMVAVLNLVALGVSALLRRRWTYVATSVVLLLTAFAMFQLSLGGPSGEDPGASSVALSGWPSWTLTVVCLAGAVLGLLGIRQMRRGTHAV